MKKKLMAILVGAAAGVPALSMAADVSIYGRAHVSADLLDDGADYSEANLSSNSSRLGFKGEHVINPELKAFFQIEQEILFGSEGDSSFNTRDTFVGLTGDFGAVQMGRFDSPFKVARGPANLFGDQVGDMRNLTRFGNARFDERYDNTLQYTTPSFNGFNAKLAYSAHEGQSVQLDADGKPLKTDSLSLSLNYAEGPLQASLAYEQAKEDTGRGERDGIRAAAAYKLTDTFKLVGFFQAIEYEDADATADQQDLWTAKTYGLGGEYKVAANTALKAMWMTRDADADNADADMWVLGVEHKLDKAVRVYANYAMVDNDDAVRLNPWSQGRSANPASTADAFGAEASALSVGFRYDF